MAMLDFLKFGITQGIKAVKAIKKLPLESLLGKTAEIEPTEMQVLPDESGTLKMPLVQGKKVDDYSPDEKYTFFKQGDFERKNYNIPDPDKKLYYENPQAYAGKHGYIFNELTGGFESKEVDKDAANMFTDYNRITDSDVKEIVSGIKDVGLGLATSTIKVLKDVSLGSAIFAIDQYKETVNNLRSLFGTKADSQDDPVRAALQDAYDYIGEKEQELASNIEDENIAALAAGTGQVAAIIAVGVKGGLPAVKLMLKGYAVATGADIYQEALQATGNPTKAALTAVPSAAVSYFLNKVGFEAVIGKLWGKQAVNRFAGIIAGGFIESLTETAEQFSTGLIKNISYDKAVPTLQDYFKTAWISGTVGLIGAGISTAVEIKAVKEAEKKTLKDLRQQGFSREGSQVLLDRFKQFSGEFVQKSFSTINGSVKEARLIGLKGLEDGKARPGIEKAAPLPDHFTETLRGTRGLTAEDITQKYPDIQLKRDVPATDVYGNKVIIPEGEALTPYELKGNKVLLQDGETYVVIKNQFQNIKGQSVVAEGKPFAPELDGTEETVLGGEFKGVKEAQAEFDKLNDRSTELVVKYPREGRTPTQQAELDAVGNRMNALHDKYRGDYDFIAKQITKRSDTKFGSGNLVLPGGRDYSEIIIKAPGPESILKPKGYSIEQDMSGDAVIMKGDEMIEFDELPKDIQDAISKQGEFISSHWPDIPNPISHIRRKIYDTEKYGQVEFMEELQSDWAREGRQKGFINPAEKTFNAEIKSKYPVPKDEGVWSVKVLEDAGVPKDLTDKWYYSNIATTKNGSVPNNSLLKNWQELSIKRALKEAVDNNSDYFAWINGEQTSARYNLATHLDEAKWTSGKEGKTITLTPKGGGDSIGTMVVDKNGVISKPSQSRFTPVQNSWIGKKLDEVLGKGLADSIMAKESGTLSGEGLKFGGEWANNLYDKQVGNIVKDLTGAKVEVLDMGLPIEKDKAWNIATESMVTKTELTPKNIKVGLEIAGESRDRYIITDILGDGKFRAVEKGKIEKQLVRAYKNGELVAEGLYSPTRLQEYRNKGYRVQLGSTAESFDISTKKSAGQQGIRLTPEIKAMVRGEAPTVETSGRKFGLLPTTALKTDKFAFLGGDKKLTPEELARRAYEEEAMADVKREIERDKEYAQEVSSLDKIIKNTPTNVKDKINLFDYLRTPENVLKKIGFEKEAKLIREGYDEYVKELPKNLEKITDWVKRVPKESNERIFDYLDGQSVVLNHDELAVATEIKTWLKDWAVRLNLPEDKTITNYITHIFDEQLIKKEFDEDLAKIIANKIPGQVYDPFLLARLGALGYKHDTWAALEAYVKRGTRKVHMDPALDAIKKKAGADLRSSNIEESQWKYLQKYINQVNLRPTDIDKLIDNFVKSVFGYKFGQRPVTALTGTFRRMTSRGLLGLNFSSALRNLSQGANTYAVLGEKYTVLGYAKLFDLKAHQELFDEGILDGGFISDRILSARKKGIQMLDSILYGPMQLGERINRGAAYFGAKRKYIAEHSTKIDGDTTVEMTNLEKEARKYAKEVVRKTQFQFGVIDQPVGLGGDIPKTITQLQNFTIKQTEFLAGLAKDKNYTALLRYSLAGLAFVYTIGRAFNMKPKELIPSFRFDAPPSVKLPYETAKAIMNTPDKYGKPRSLEDKIGDISLALYGLVPASSQLKKTAGAVAALIEGGEVVTSSGKVKFAIDTTSTIDVIQALLFGVYNSESGQTYLNKIKNGASLETIQPVYDEIQKLVEEGEDERALAIYDDLSANDKKLYQQLKVFPTYHAIQKLKEEGKTDEALVLYDQLSDKGQKAYQQLKKANAPDLTVEDSGKEKIKDRSGLGLVSDYTKAFFIDPGNAWKALTTKEKLGIVKGNLVELQRFYGIKYTEKGGSEEYKRKKMKEMNIPLEDISEYKLEHIVPVKAGGDNSDENLVPINNEEHDSYTRIDILMAKAIQSDKITRKEVEKLARAMKVEKSVTIQEAETKLLQL